MVACIESGFGPVKHDLIADVVVAVAVAVEVIGLVVVSFELVAVVAVGFVGVVVGLVAVEAVQDFVWCLAAGVDLDGQKPFVDCHVDLRRKTHFESQS